MKTLIIFLLLAITGCSNLEHAPQEQLLEISKRPEATKYLKENPETKVEFKEAILAGKVVLGMCPNEAIAAAGRPGPYMIVKDKKWGSNVPPPVVAMAQCKEPDESVVEFLFKNDRQYGKGEVFHVRFERGKAVLIDQNGFTGS